MCQLIGWNAARERTFLGEGGAERVETQNLTRCCSTLGLEGRAVAAAKLGGEIFNARAYAFLGGAANV